MCLVPRAAGSRTFSMVQALRPANNGVDLCALTILHSVHSGHYILSLFLLLFLSKVKKWCPFFKYYFKRLSVIANSHIAR